MSKNNTDNYAQNLGFTSTANQPDFRLRNTSLWFPRSLGVPSLRKYWNKPENNYLPVYTNTLVKFPYYNLKSKQEKPSQESLILIEGVDIKSQPEHEYLLKYCFNRDIDDKIQKMLQEVASDRNAKLVAVTVNFSAKIRSSYNKKKSKKPAKEFRNSLRVRDKQKILGKTIIVLEAEDKRSKTLTHAHMIAITYDIKAFEDLLKWYAKDKGRSIEVKETYEQETRLVGNTLANYEIDFDHFGYPPRDYLKPEAINQDNEYWINAKFVPEHVEIRHGKPVKVPDMIVRRLPVDRGWGFYISKQLTTKNRVEARVADMRFPPKNQKS